jgi:hypothetical protein
METNCLNQKLLSIILCNYKYSDNPKSLEYIIEKDYQLFGYENEKILKNELGQNIESALNQIAEKNEKGKYFIER